jgi:hypothetical protein
MPAPNKPSLDPALVQKAANSIAPSTPPASSAPVPPPPADQAKLAKLLDPFIDLGKSIGAG